MIYQGPGFKYASPTNDRSHATHYTFVDEREVRDRWWHPKAGDVVLDIGANYGSYSLPALAVGATVHAFIPLDDERAVFEESVKANGWEDRCTVLPYGIHGIEGFHLTDGHAIRCATLDGYALGRFPRLDWIKMDVEGAELEALRGGHKVIAEHKPKMLVENHQFVRATMEAEVIALVVGWKLGYRHESRKYNDVTHTLFEVR